MEKVGRWEKEKRSEGLGTECPRAKGRGSDTKGHEDNMTDAGGTRPYQGWWDSGVRGGEIKSKIRIRKKSGSGRVKRDAPRDLKVGQ